MGQSTAQAASAITVTNLKAQHGQLLASGVVAIDQNLSVPFSNVPVLLSATPAQAGSCPILNLSLAPIDLNLLGLEVQTSQICLDITAQHGGGLLGNLLCNVANLLNRGVNINQVLGALTRNQAAQLLSGLTQIINGALAGLDLNNAVVSAVGGTSCTVLDLALGPLNLNLLGLQVDLDNCANGPVTVTITAHQGEGLLGDLLCGLVNDNLLNLGMTLQQILALLQSLGQL